jgi:hypothetical protein
MATALQLFLVAGGSTKQSTTSSESGSRHPNHPRLGPVPAIKPQIHHRILPDTLHHPAVPLRRPRRAHQIGHRQDVPWTLSRDPRRKAFGSDRGVFDCEFLGAAAVRRLTRSHCRGDGAADGEVSEQV